MLAEWRIGDPTTVDCVVVDDMEPCMLKLADTDMVPEFIMGLPTAEDEELMGPNELPEFILVAEDMKLLELDMLPEIMVGLIIATEEELTDPDTLPEFTIVAKDERLPELDMLPEFIPGPLVIENEELMDPDILGPIAMDDEERLLDLDILPEAMPGPAAADDEELPDAEMPEDDMLELIAVADEVRPIALLEEGMLELTTATEDEILVDVDITIELVAAAEDVRLPDPALTGPVLEAVAGAVEDWQAVPPSIPSKRQLTSETTVEMTPPMPPPVLLDVAEVLEPAEIEG